MIIRQTPKDIENFICVDSAQSLILQKNGFHPMYIDENGIYYKKTEKLLERLMEEFC